MKKIALSSLILASALLTTGCASQSAPEPATHNWVAKNRADEARFEQNNRSCAQSANGVSAYESCMTDNGYHLYNQD